MGAFYRRFYEKIQDEISGVFYREAERIGGRGKEKIFYILFKKDGRLYEEKVGRQYADDMTDARAARIRAERIEETAVKTRNP